MCLQDSNMPTRDTELKLNDLTSERLFEHGIRATASVTIMRPAADLYRVWRELEQLPRFIDHLESVEVLDGTRSRWTVEGPGQKVSWEASIIRDEPGSLISWKSDAPAKVPNAGTIRFRELPGDRGTQVHVVIVHVPPGGAIGNAVAKLVGDDARTQVKEAMHRFRQLMETGEIPTTRGQPVGAAQADSKDNSVAEAKTDRNLRDITDPAPVQRGASPQPAHTSKKATP